MEANERLRINIALYQRWLGHEGHEIAPWSNPTDALACHTCIRETGKGYLPDLTTDANAMLALKDALEEQGYSITLGGKVGSRRRDHATIWHPHPVANEYGDTLPEALALAAMQLPEESRD